MIHKYLVQVEFGETTRWIPGGEEVFQRKVISLATVAAQYATEGRMPAVTILKEERPEAWKPNSADGSAGS